MFNFFLKYIFLIILVFSFFSVYASQNNGTIDTINYSALLCANDDCTISSQINFLTSNGINVVITDNKITGEIWSENMGWINLNPTNAGVVNTEDGILGGYAWGENTGWINFAPTNGGVSINTTGEFVGYAWAQNAGWIKFDCSVVNACVKTDWRPLSVRSNNSSGSLAHIQNTPSISFIPSEVDSPLPPVFISTPPLSPIQPPIMLPDDSQNYQNKNDSNEDNTFSSRDLDFASSLEEIQKYKLSFNDVYFSDLNEKNSQVDTNFIQTKANIFTNFNEFIIGILNKIIDFFILLFNLFI